MAVSGDEILVRTISTPRLRASGSKWSYDSRSDHHSNVSSWGIVFDLMRNSPLMQKHAIYGKIAFGLNHPFTDFTTQKPKKLDLVICRPALSTWPKKKRKPHTLLSLADKEDILLICTERSELLALPPFSEALVGSVLVAVEIKACMTEHVKAIPRLHDELNSSHRIVHGENDEAIAAGFVVINIAEQFFSSDRNFGRKPRDYVPNEHKQPHAVEATLAMLSQLPRRAHPGAPGYDALGAVVIDCKNDGSKVTMLKSSPSPGPNSSFNYAAFITRLRGFYETRFAHI